jgi:hypothetical protein
MPNDIEVLVLDDAPWVCERDKAFLERGTTALGNFLDQSLYPKEVRAPMKEAPTRTHKLG